MNINNQTRFNQVYQAYLNELTLQSKSPKTVNIYSRCIRQVSVFFDTCPDALTAAELKTYFLSFIETKSWSAVNIARNAIQTHLGHTNLITTARYTKMTEEVNQNSALMINNMLSNVQIDWVDDSQQSSDD
jgi:site-specific recombinase XerD